MSFRKQNFTITLSAVLAEHQCTWDCEKNERKSKGKSRLHYLFFQQRPEKQEGFGAQEDGAAALQSPPDG